MCLSDLSALDVNVMFVHAFIQVLMGLLTAWQPWVGLVCSRYKCVQLLLLITTAFIITTLISSHLISSHPLSLISLTFTALSLSLSVAPASAWASASWPPHQHINTSATHQQHISNTSATHQQHVSNTSAHQHISTITSASSASHQTGPLLGKHQHDNMLHESCIPFR